MCVHAVTCTWPLCTNRHAHIIRKGGHSLEIYYQVLDHMLEELRLPSVPHMANRAGWCSSLL